MTRHIAATFLQACDDLAAQCDALCRERGLMHRAHDAWPVAPDVDGMELGEPVGSTVRHGRVETCTRSATSASCPSSPPTAA